jgi:uncharacterized protein (TIGR02421 family)
LLAHEVSTHLVTYFNGSMQSLAFLTTGLAGYDELQEGLALIAEYLVGGLTEGRLRLLAGRVIAVQRLTEGAGFVDIFRELRLEHGFADQTAFFIAMRVTRGGGLTKDAVYLRGLVRLLEYFREGKPIEPLFAGKFATRHLAFVRELTERELLKPPVWRPLFLDDADAGRRLEHLAGGRSVFDLCERSES